MSNKKKVRIVCSCCGSEDIREDAYCSWDVELQDWVLSAAMPGNAVCERCGGECSTEEVPVSYDPWAFPRDINRVIVRENSDRKVFEVYHYAPGVVRGDAEVLEDFGVLAYANQAAKDFAAQFDDCVVVLEGEDYP